MPISRSTAVKRGFAANARWSACGSVMAREERSAAWTGIVRASSAHVRRKPALIECIIPTQNANDDARQYRAQRRSSGQVLWRGGIQPRVIRQQHRRRRQGKPSRMLGRACRNIRSRRHTSGAGVTVITNRRRMLRRAVVGTIGHGANIHIDSHGNRLLNARNSMGQTDEQVNQSKDHKHRTTNAWCLSRKSGPAGSMSHTRRLANPEPEHYHKLSSDFIFQRTCDFCSRVTLAESIKTRRRAARWFPATQRNALLLPQFVINPAAAVHSSSKCEITRSGRKLATGASL